jgi:hypothetical protein
MQLTLCLAALSLLAATVPAAAGICVLSLPTAGTLGMSADGRFLGSEYGALPVAGTLTVASIGSSTLTIDPPQWMQTAAAYHSAGELREVSYSAPVSGGAQSYTSGSSSITVPNLVNAVILTINTRVTNSVGFSDGTYKLRTVVTCS